MAQTVIVGVDQLNYAILTAGTDTLTTPPVYETIYPLLNVGSIKITKGGTVSVLRGDNRTAYAAGSKGDISVEIVLADIEPADQARILGHAYGTGILQEGSTDVAPEIALMFRILRNTGAYEYVTIPKIVMSVADTAATTKAATVEFQSPTITGMAMQLANTNGDLIKARSDDPLVSAVTLAAWFTTVVFKPSIDVGALAVAITVVSLTTSFVITKTGGGLITLTQANLNSVTMPIFKAGALQAGTYVITNNGTATVTVIFTPSVAFGTASVSASVITRGVYDQNGVYVTQKNAILSY